MDIVKSTPPDLSEVLKLLKLVDLLIEGVKECFSTFFVIKDNNTVIGTVGIEVYETVGLLRSLTIHPDFQGKGLGQQMVNKIEQFSAEKKFNRISKRVSIKSMNSGSFFITHFKLYIFIII